ncbi:MAG: DUF4365 domain-containing protein [Planctomycetota bacterium]|jgi:hypothetical protein
MGNYSSNLTSTQIGSIGENVAATGLMIATEGRLSPFYPVADDQGIDLLMYDKKTGKALPIQVKSRTTTIKKRGGRGKSNIVHFEIRTVAVKGKKLALFLAILLDRHLKIIERAWLIPMKDIPRVLTKRSKYSKYVMRANRSLSAKDKFTPYRCDNVGEVARRLLSLLEKTG